MLLRQAGDALRYGLSQELFDTKKKEQKNYHLKAFLIYFVLKEYINRHDAIKLFDYLEQENETIAEKERVFEKMFTIICSNIKKIITFDDADSMFDALNEIEIPIWVFKKEYVLCKLFPNIYMNGELIYYVIEIERRWYFRCIHTSEAESIRCFSHSYFEEAYDESVEYNENNYTISNNYNYIYAFNPIKRVFYLGFAYINTMYVEYHIDTREHVLRHNKLYGVINNTVPVIKDNDGNIALVLEENKIHVLRKTESYEMYTVENDLIRVQPDYSSIRFFEPYTISASGEIKNVSHKESLSYLLNRINKDIYGFEKNDSLINYFNNNEFTLFNFKKYLFNNLDLERNQGGKRYYLLIDILEKYFEKNDDCKHIFYCLADITYRLKKDYLKVLELISDELLQIINEKDALGQLNIIRNDSKGFKQLLLEETYWNDDRLKWWPFHEQKYEPKIGSFIFDKNDNLHINSINCSSGKFTGTQIIPTDTGDFPGLVTYNVEGFYEIQYNRELTQNEIEKIVESEFDIKERAYVIIIEEKETLK